MTLHLLPDAELSKFIAEKLEPKPLWTHTRKSREYLGTFYSDGKCWQRRFDHGEPKPDEPRDMVNDAAMTVMLLEKLRDHHKIVTVRIAGMIRVTVGSETAPDAESGPTAPLGRAVAEAFALANGYQDDALRSGRAR